MAQEASELTRPCPGGMAGNPLALLNGREGPPVVRHGFRIVDQRALKEQLRQRNRGIRERHENLIRPGVVQSHNDIRGAGGRRIRGDNAGCPVDREIGRGIDRVVVVIRGRCNRDIRICPDRHAKFSVIARRVIIRCLVIFSTSPRKAARSDL